MTDRHDFFERQERLFGKEGQNKISQCHVMVCGAGGIGSHVAQQLIYLGVKRIDIVDSDIVEHSNMNRLIGASISDVGKPKAKALGDYLKRINPDVQVTELKADINDKAIRSQISVVDLVLGCVDNDAARLVLTDLSSTFRKPYLDIASEIHPNSDTIGGHIFLANGAGCLLCAGELDQDEINAANSTETQLEFRKHVYGIDQINLADSGPAVVSLNGLMASIGVTEAMMFLTGLSEPIQWLKIKRRQNFHSWTFEKPNIDNNKDCYYCKRYKAA